jgi:DNA repair protein RadD
MILRPYQSRALDELWTWFHKHDSGNPIVNAVVGAGKSVLIAALCQRAMSEYPGTRILVVVHQKELLEQNLDKLRAVWPAAPVGVHSASVGKSDLGHDILYATIGSIQKKAHLLGRVDLVLCDECHLINPKEEGMWRNLIAGLQKYNPACRVIGWTGTPFRGSGVWLTASETPLFHGVATKVTMRELIDLGFLAPLKAGGVNTVISAEGISVVNGDYKISELAERVDKEELVEAACDEIVQLATNRKRWLVFCVTVEHAKHVCDALIARGIASGIVSAVTPKAERAALIEDFRSGRLRCLCNVAVLTTGFDVPEVDCIALLRNTKSPVLYVQIAGRGMRVVGANIVESARNGKSDCLWLDFTDTTSNLGPVDAIQGRGPKRKMAHEMPVKLCETCGSINSVSARECIDCGAPFEIAASDPHGVRASDAAIMSGQTTLTRYTVDRVTYAKHSKPGKPPSLRVEYWHGLRVVAKEWVGIESDSPYGRGRAVNWWSQREPQPMKMVPGNVEQCIEWIDGGFKLKQPTAIIVNESMKYPQIISQEWEQAA